MKINFEKLKEHLIVNFGEDEEEILESIEKLKGLPYGIFGAMEDLINKEWLDQIDEDLGYDTDLLTEYYFESHPDYPDDEDIEEADDYNDFYDNLTEEQKKALLWESFENISDGEKDNLHNKATENAAEMYGLPAFIAKCFCSNACYFNPPDWSSGDDEDKSTPEEIEAEYFAYIQKSGTFLRHVPEALMTEALCVAAVRQNSNAFEYVPENLKTEEVYFALIQNAARTGGKNNLIRVLDKIPDNLKTEKMFLEAVKQDGSTLQYVPENLRTAEICLPAVQNNYKAIKYVPAGLRTAEIWFAVVQLEGGMLKHVPEHLKTAELCLTAVQQNAWALRYVPDEFKTVEMCHAGVQQDSQVFIYVPEHLKTLEVCLAAVQKYIAGFTLDHVPAAHKTPEVCLTAVKGWGFQLKYVPKELRTLEICIAAYRQAEEKGEYDPEDLFDHSDRYIPQCLWEQVDAALQGDSDVAYPERVRSEQQALNFLRENPSGFKEIPLRWRSREVCLLAITYRGNVCAHIPEHLQSEDFFLEAVKVNTNGKALKYIPEEFRTLKVCTAAVQLFPEAMEFVVEKVDALERQGIKHQKNDKFTQAIEPYSQAIELLQQKTGSFADYIASILYNRSLCYAQIGQFNEALVDINKAIENHPKETNYFIMRALVYEDLNQFDKAIADCRKALELDSDNEAAKKTLARCEAALESAKAAPAP